MPNALSRLLCSFNDLADLGGYIVQGNLVEIKVNNVIEYICQSALNVTNLNTANKRKLLNPEYITSLRMTATTIMTK